MPNVVWRRSHSCVSAALLLLAVGVLAPRPAQSATATFINTANGRSASGTQNGNPRNVGYAGTFNIQIDSMPPNREAYCVDINNGIAPGNTLPQIPPDYPAEVLFILNNAFPQPNTIGTPLAALNNEAAAVQSAIWSYTDNFVVSSPADVAARAAEIVAAANAAGPLLPSAAPRASAWIRLRQRTSYPATAAIRSPRPLATAWAIRSVASPSRSRSCPDLVREQPLPAPRRP